MVKYSPRERITIDEVIKTLNYSSFLKTQCEELMKRNQKLEEEIYILKNEYAFNPHSYFPQQEIWNGMTNNQGYVHRSIQYTDNLSDGRQTPTSQARGPFTPSSPPIFILDPGSKVHSQAIVDFLKAKIKENTREQVVQPMKAFFEPIKLAMNKKFGGFWMNLYANHYDPRKANCLEGRIIRYKIQWNVPHLGTTDHVTFQLNSARK